ncbi:hypothetical protein OHA54_00330 [Streptomyces anulatus]|nr:hypothetical protein OHA54_00330 [Streptomyces anulatus]WTE01052.1 hypothetical protein OH765_00325 [Streptomyces anulatus]
MDNIRCTQCGAVGLTQGFVDESGQGARGFVRWIAGPLQRSRFGFVKKVGRPTYQIDAYRCPTCAHLELFAAQRD